jgi:hypothetical protein
MHLLFKIINCNIIAFYLFNQNTYEPICKVYRDELQFTGVSISENLILTVGHVGYNDHMFVEFHGENGNKFKVKAKIIKQSNSLTLLTYNKPKHINGSVGILKVGKAKPTRIDLKGWDGQFFYWYEGIDARKVSIQNRIDSFIAIENKMLVGIQSNQYGNDVYFTNANEIINFLEGN